MTYQNGHRTHNTCTVIDTQSRTIIQEIPMENPPHYVHINPHRDEMYTLNESVHNTVSIIDTKNHILKGEPLVLTSRSTHSILSPNGEFLCTMCSNCDQSHLEIIKTEDRSLTRIPMKTGISYGVFTCDSAFLYVTQNQFISKVDMHQQSVHHIDTTFHASFQQIKLSPDEKTLYTHNGRLVFIMNTEDESTQYYKFTHDSKAHQMTMRPDGAFLYFAHLGRLFSIMNTHTGETTSMKLKGEVSYPTLSPDGRRLYVLTKKENSIYVIDTYNHLVEKERVLTYK